MQARQIRIFLVLIFIFAGAVRMLFAENVPQAAVAQTQINPRVDLDVKDVDIRDVARMFSRVSGLNIVVSDDVVAKVTFRATDVDWETALSMILKTYNLTSQREGNFLRIITYARLRQQEEGVPLATRVFFLNFAKADDMMEALSSLKSGRGRINADTTTNSLVIIDTPDTIEQMLKVIKEIDKRTPQVMIEAMMLDVKLSNEDQLGINWSVVDKERSYRSFIQTLSASRSEGIIRYGKTILPYANLSAVIDLWAQDKKAEILANPKVLTLDGRTAKIELTDEIPYLSSSIESTTGVVTTSASFRQAGIKLDVTPQISVGGSIFLNIKTEQSFQSSTVTTSSGAQPVIDSRKAETNLLVEDNETIVIGGLRKKDITATIDKIPLLGDIPFLGKLFQRSVKKAIDTELLIFVTPYIMTDAHLTAREEKNLEKFDALREKRKEVKLSEEAPFKLRPLK